eukprot:1171394-Pleurochrysis_carterae.AAC.2
MVRLLSALALAVFCPSSLVALVGSAVHASLTFYSAHACEYSTARTRQLDHAHARVRKTFSSTALSVSCYTPPNYMPSRLCFPCVAVLPHG